MEKAFEFISKQFTEGNYAAVVIFGLLFLAANFQRISNFFLERRKIKIELIEKSLADSNVRGLTKEFLKEQIETE